MSSSISQEDLQTSRLKPHGFSLCYVILFSEVHLNCFSVLSFLEFYLVSFLNSKSFYLYFLFFYLVNFLYSLAKKKIFALVYLSSLSFYVKVTLELVLFSQTGLCPALDIAIWIWFMDWNLVQNSNESKRTLWVQTSENIKLDTTSSNKWKLQITSSNKWKLLVQTSENY